LADELDRIVLIEGLGASTKWRRVLELARSVRECQKQRVADLDLARGAV
jgi:hypothetical protein